MASASVPSSQETRLVTIEGLKDKAEMDSSSGEPLSELIELERPLVGGILMGIGGLGLSVFDWLVCIS